MTLAIRSRSRRLGVRLAPAAMVVGALMLSGCSADDVELNGKIFDVVGLNSGSTRAAEPKMAARAPLVMPPNPERVPEPGLPPEGQAADVAALADPDVRVKTSRAELERQQAEYCKVHYEQAKALGDNDADSASGPLGPCRGSILSAVKKWTAGEETEE
ncbi:hypothetical protein [Hyphomicrobium sp.]|uniref:hypothetical protein n=1 Tax=Hyphomicrobium sp. TaxID=82 RepID=UPI002FDC9CBB